MRILARFMLSASDLTHFPPAGLPEIAFLGRSNVGKSSLINSLVEKKLARTSNTPGRTRSINFYEVRRAGQPRPELFFADLPGYGYAKVSREISADWSRFVDPYLHQRPSLGAVPCSRGCEHSASGQRSANYWNSCRPRTSPCHRRNQVRSDVRKRTSHRLLRKLGQEYPGVPIVPFSAKTGAGKDELWDQIRVAVGKLPPSVLRRWHCGRISSYVLPRYLRHFHRFRCESFVSPLS